MNIDKRRTRVVVERDFQYRFTLKLCLWGGLVIVGFGVLFLFTMKTSYDMLISRALGTLPGIVISQLERELRMISVMFVACIVMMIAGLFGLGLVVSQKLAGPIVALQKRLRDFSEGKSGVRLNLRKEDEFHSIETIFNTAMESHEGRYGKKLDSLTEVYFDLVNKNPSSAQTKLAHFLEDEGRLAKL